MLKLLIILPCLLLMFQPLNAKVEAPNYNFSLDTLNDFMPGKPEAELEKKYGKPEMMSNEGGMRTLKFQVAHIRYKFPVIVQVREGEVQDFFARLPSYFLHDVFFQSLINRLGKQTTYKKTGEEAYYTWDAKPLKHIYSAACTITCFPIFYAVHPADMTSNLMNKMKKANSK
ncbi:hypothetical protein ACJVC5_03245 [Peredibacter sp. HCB2-198]|uniref:hypothetical protein n=1 Tax=Peredibacter sp. HCB2-198 TaxID=3383025 RepID=UPI0038B6507F